MQVNPYFEDPPNDAALARYLSGESALEERLDIERWVARDPARRTMLSYTAAAWDEPQHAVETWDTEALLTNLIARRDAVQPSAPILHTVSMTAKRPPNWSSRSIFSPAVPALIGLAAVVVSVIGISLYNNRQHTVAPAATMARANDQWEFATAPGQRAVVTLVDGTTVTLGVASRLYPTPGFGAGRREVVLDGEAHFDVVNDASAPFIIRTGETVTRVLGTTFNVRKYTTDSSVEIAVSAGKVAIGHGEATTLLTAGDIGRIDQDGKSTILHNPVLVDAQTQWRQGWLVIDNLTLRQAAIELSRWYDLDIDIASEALADRHITVSFRNELPNAVIRSVAQALNARAEWSGRQVTFFER